MTIEQLQVLMDGVRTGQLSRREFMRRAAVLGLSGSAIAAFLAACGAASTATPAPVSGAASAAPAASAAASTVPAASTAAGGGATSGNIKLYSSFPLNSASKDQMTSIINAYKLALEEVNYKVGNFTIVFGATESLDDGSPASGGKWDAAVEAANAQKALADADCMVYMGTFNSGAAKVSIPLMNAANICMISPANTYTGLTRKLEGAVEKNEPEVYYPNGKRNYCRTCSHDDLQGAAQAAYMKEIGVKKLYVLDDSELYGHGVAVVLSQQAKKLGIEIANTNGDSESIDTKAPDYRSLAQKIKTSGADTVSFGGITDSNAGKLWKDLRSVLGNDVKLFGPDGLFEQAFLDAAGDASEGTYFSFGGIPPEQLQGKGADFVKKYKDKYKTDLSAYTAYAYEAMNVLLDGIKRAGKKDRAAIRDAIMSTKDWDGVLGKWSFEPDTGDSTLTTMSISQAKGGKFEFIKLVQPKLA
jgi:branched-chain amino acid transport system substrate-binding protein